VKGEQGRGAGAMVVLSFFMKLSQIKNEGEALIFYSSFSKLLAASQEGHFLGLQRPSLVSPHSLHLNTAMGISFFVIRNPYSVFRNLIFRF
jgi:hypothetical protein